MTDTNDLIDFMQTLTNYMADEYKRIRKKSKNDNGTAGDEGEENWKYVFEQWLPSDYYIRTKGKIMNEEGVSSPQVDIVILYPYYPKALLDKKIYLTSGVAAAFECKNTFKSEHLKKAFENSVKVRALYPKKKGDHLTELYSPILYGILAHSHDVKTETKKPVDSITKSILSYDSKIVKSPIEQLDIICISDLALWSSLKQPMTTIWPKQISGKFTYEHGPTTSYCHANNSYFDQKEKLENYKPIGALLARLYKMLSKKDPRLTNMADYFSRVNIASTDLAQRKWPREYFSKEAIAELDKLQKQSTDGTWNSYFD